MKLLFIVDTLASGGKERRLTELLKALVTRQDIEFELAVMSNNIHYLEILDLGINIHYVIRRTKKDFAVFYSFYKLCKNYHPEIVHCWDSMTAVYLSLVCKILHIKLVNGMVIDSPVRQNILNKHWLRARLTFPFSDVIVGNSKAGLVAYKAPEHKSKVIYNGFNFIRTENLIKSSVIRQNLEINTPFIVGMVATFSGHKDYPTFYNAAQLLLEKRKDVTFIAIGAGTDSHESKSLISKANIDSFKLLGKKHGVESFVNAMDICVLSTYTEGISNSILEYMALGKPVVATSGGGTGELVINAETGFLIKPSNPEELAEKVELLLNNQRLRTEMGLAGNKRILDLFSIDQMTDKYIDLYKTILEN